MVILGIALIAMGIGGIISAANPSERRVKIISGVLIVLSLYFLGVFHYLYASGKYGAQFIFFNELPNFGTVLGPNIKTSLHMLGEIFYTPISPSYKDRGNPYGAYIVPLCQFGAIYMGLKCKTWGARVFGWTVTIWIGSLALLILFLYNFFYYTGSVYLGSDPRGFIQILWPFYVICLSSVIFFIIEEIVQLIKKFFNVKKDLSRFVPITVLIISLLVPFSFFSHRYFNGLNTSKDLQFILPQGFNDGQQPINKGFNNKNEITEYLRSKLSIFPGSQYQGSAYFMPTAFDSNLKSYGVWRRENTFTYARWYIGNDIGQYSLRHLNVPTLDQITHNISPPFYLTVRELLTRPGIDIYERHYGGIVTQLNPRILELLGVRFLMADYDLPIGAHRLSWDLPKEVATLMEFNRLLKSRIKIYELENTNLGNYSPTSVLYAKTAKEMIVAMGAKSFDGKKTLITDNLNVIPNLVPVETSKMEVRIGGLNITATSRGNSVLVLPVQFSNCWNVLSGDKVKLFRADMMLLAMEFSGHVNVELRQAFGPFGESDCRLKDLNDMTRLRVGDALGSLKEASESFKTHKNELEGHIDLFDSKINLSVKELNSQQNLSPEFLLKAEGGESAHIASVKVPILPVGNYTFSFEVKSEGLRFLALQILDGANKGALVDYLPLRQMFWINKIGEATGVDASIKKLDDQWFRISLSTTLTTKSENKLQIILKDKGNDTLFKPRGEKIIIRNLRIENSSR
jgi:hypothetical protein